MGSHVTPATLALLEKAYSTYHSEQRRPWDPISLVHEYSNRADQEVVAFLAGILAYGNVKTILASVRKVLEPMGDCPTDFILSEGYVGRYARFKHRFTTGDDIEIVCRWLQSALTSHQSLERFFVAGSSEDEMKILLSSFVSRFVAQPLPVSLHPVLRRRARNLKYLLPDPQRGSACKRLNMFLRWVVRKKDAIDLGLWQTVRPDQLMLPVDTHLLQTLRALKWTKSKQASWKVVEEATEILRALAPEDPIRFDFALCHLSMSGGSILDYA